MSKQLQKIWKDVLSFLRTHIWQIFAIHLAYIACGVLLFAPLTGVLGQFLLNLSGQSVLSDLDIAYFFLTPAGMFAAILFVSLLLTILIFEQASLMAVCYASMQGQRLEFIPALFFTVKRIKIIFLFAVRLVLRVLLITLPFIGLSFAIAWVMLTDYDINYYLATRPPIFKIAAISIGLILTAMTTVLIRNLSSWSFTLPLILFHNESPAHSFARSEELSRGNKQLFLLTFGSWLLSGFLLAALTFGVIEILGSLLAPFFFHSLPLLIPALGALVLLWFLSNLLVTTFTSGSFAALLIHFYDHKEIGNYLDLFARDDSKGKNLISRPLFFILLLAAIGIATLTGFLLLQGIPAENDALIIAHRGASGKAPENTLVAMRHAINDGADWLEIDVQESKDGEIVVIHDSDFMKLGGVNLKLWDGSLEEIQKIDVGSWFNAGFSTERVPTLAQVLELATDRCNVLIELKYYGHDQQLEQRVVDIVEESDMVNNVAIMSLQYEGIQILRALRPGWRTGLLTTKALGKISDLKVDFLAINMSAASPAFIRRIHTMGKEVYIWTVNDRVSMSRMMSLGVDGVITDEPALAGEVRSKNKTLSPVERLLLHTAVLFDAPIPQHIYRDQSP